MRSNQNGVMVMKQKYSLFLFYFKWDQTLKRSGIWKWQEKRTGSFMHEMFYHWRLLEISILGFIYKVCDVKKTVVKLNFVHLILKTWWFRLHQPDLYFTHWRRYFWYKTLPQYTVYTIYLKASRWYDLALVSIMVYNGITQ